MSYLSFTDIANFGILIVNREQASSMIITQSKRHDLLIALQRPQP